MLTEANGWQKVTDISTLTLSDYYFSFVDKENALMLSFETGINQSSSIDYKTMVYRTAKKAENTPAMLWTLEKNSNGTSYTIKSAVDQTKFLQTEWKAAWYCRTHNNGGGSDSWGAWNFSLSDGAYTLENNKYSGNYVGPWEDSQFKNGMAVAGNKKGDNVGHFYLYAILRSNVNWLDNASEDNPVDVTYNIINPNAAFDGTTGWTAEGTNVEFKRNGDPGFDGVEGFFEPSAWGKDNFDFNTTQTISGLPAGKYKVRAAAQAAAGTTFTMTCGDDTHTFPANGVSGGTIDQGGNTVASGSGVAGWTWGECNNILRTDGNLTITFHSKASASQHWANYDNVELYFLGKTISGKAPTASASPLSAEANTWYVFDVVADANYKLSPSTGTILYTQDGTLMPSEVTTSLTSETELTLAKGKLYVKASENATITLALTNLYSTFAALYEQCKPWTTEGEFVEKYNSYSAYTESTSAAELQEAIEYLTANYDTYAWDNANMEHPYDTKTIVNPTYDNGETGWSKTQNSTGGYSDGIDTNGNNYYYKASRQVRHATIYQEGIKLKAGTYCLSANMTGDIKDATSTYIYATDGAVNHWSDGIFDGNVWKGYLTTTNNWTNVKCYFTLSQETTLRIGALSWGNNRSGNTKGNFAVDDWKLEYVKYVVDANDNSVTVYGPVPVDEINAKITSDITTIDLTQATSLSNATIATEANPNAIIYATQGAVSNNTNVVVDGTCANFVLTDGHPFVAAKSFSATNASYTMTAIADGKFGTLMLPFAAQLPTDGKAYALDADIDVIGGKVCGSEVSALTANTPVLVTKAGAYTGSNVDIAATTATAYTNGNLTGVYAQTAAPQGSYVLQNHPQSQGVAFYLVGDVKPTVKPFRAYIPAQSSNAKALKVVFDGDVTAISGIAADEDACENVYDLSGRKVAKARKGVYIKNGKKVIIK